jgi:hypothetical protein
MLRWCLLLVLFLLAPMSMVAADPPRHPRHRHVDEGRKPHVRLPRLRGDQFRIAQDPARIKVVAMGRRWGKTLMAGSLCMAVAASGQPVAWVVPTYRNAEPVWRFLLFHVADLEASGDVVVRKGIRTIIFPATGGRISIFTADNDTAIRGEAFKLVVVDEAARVAETTYTDVLRPTIADLDGTIVLISTPRGRNWFWREWLSGQTDETGYIKSWKAPSLANPNPNIKRAYHLAREKSPWRSFAQEWDAEFLEDGGAVFRGVRQLARGNSMTPYQAGHVYVVGIDLARKTDYTAVAVLDVTTLPVTLVAMDRFTGISWSLQKGRIKALVEHYHAVRVLVDATGPGDPVFEDLNAMLATGARRMDGIWFNNLRKGLIIEHLSLLVERGGIRLLPWDILLNELEAYEAKTLPVSGLTRYTAPDGFHDDTVIALALAAEGAKDAVPPVPMPPGQGGPGGRTLAAVGRTVPLTGGQRQMRMAA